MNLLRAEEYIEEHPEWKASTVGMAVSELRELAETLRDVGNAFAQLNSYADGPRRDLDDALLTLERELDDRIAYWTSPLDEEIADSEQWLQGLGPYREEADADQEDYGDPYHPEHDHI